MYKLILLIPLLVGSAFAATDGYSVYKEKCAACHAESLNRKEALKVVDTLKAPPMNQVSKHLKNHIYVKGNNEQQKRRVIIAFIKDYITNPNQADGFCKPMAYKKFGVMPSLKGAMNDEEIQAVSVWVYDNFKGTKGKEGRGCLNEKAQQGK